MNGVCESSGWEIRDEDSYGDSVLECGGYELVDSALLPVDEALHRNPLGFAFLHKASDIRFAKTKLRIGQGDVIPAMTLFFHADEAHRIVRKLHVKISSPSTMAIDTEPWKI
jgi:hypothetical protein